jgi:hypothetical protein
MEFICLGSGAKSLSLGLPIFHESFLFALGFFPQNEEISVPSPHLISDWRLSIAD